MTDLTAEEIAELQETCGDEVHPRSRVTWDTITARRLLAMAARTVEAERMAGAALRLLNNVPQLIRDRCTVVWTDTVGYRAEHRLAREVFEYAAETVRLEIRRAALDAPQPKPEGG